MSLQTKLESLCLDPKFNMSEEYYREFSYKVTKGMGVTIGNSLRRTLLSQIPGNAIRYVVINGLNHEFSSIPGVKESAQELIMNLRKIVFKEITSLKKTNKCVKAILNISRPGEVFASDVKCTSYAVVNDKLYLCTLEEGASLKVELNIGKGVGIILSTDIKLDEIKTDIKSSEDVKSGNIETEAKLPTDVKSEDIEMDAIICDAFFNPVYNVNFNVTRIENNTKEELLTLTIHTNGSVSPDEAMDLCIDIWRKEMARISEKMIVSAQDEIQSKQLRVLSDTLYYKVSEIQGMTTRILNCIRSLNIKYVGELVKFTKKELLEKPNFGENSLNQLVELLSNIGLTLGMDVTGWEVPVNEMEENTLIR